MEEVISKGWQTADQLSQGSERKGTFPLPPQKKQKEIGNQPIHWLRIKGSVGSQMGSRVALV